MTKEHTFAPIPFTCGKANGSCIILVVRGDCGLLRAREHAPDGSTLYTGTHKAAAMHAT